jgi:hypothetical protein
MQAVLLNIRLPLAYPYSRRSDYTLGLYICASCTGSAADTGYSLCIEVEN